MSQETNNVVVNTRGIDGNHSWHTKKLAYAQAINEDLVSEFIEDIIVESFAQKTPDEIKSLLKINDALYNRIAGSDGLEERANESQDCLFEDIQELAPGFYGIIQVPIPRSFHGTLGYSFSFCYEEPIFGKTIEDFMLNAQLTANAIYKKGKKEYYETQNKQQED